MKRLLLGLLLTTWTLAVAAETTLVVEDAWVREAPPTARMLAAYMRLKNPTPEEYTLVAVSSPLFEHVMLHKSEVVDGMARMQHQDQIVIPAHGSLVLEPGSYHLMMPAPDTRLSAGDRVEFVLDFANGKRIRVQAEVRKKP